MALELLEITCCLVQRELRFPRLQQAVQPPRNELSLDHSPLQPGILTILSSCALTTRPLFSIPSWSPLSCRQPWPCPLCQPCSVHFFLSLSWTLPEASGRSHSQQKTPLNHTIEESSQQFLHCTSFAYIWGQNPCIHSLGAGSRGSPVAMHCERCHGPTSDPAHPKFFIVA